MRPVVKSMLALVASLASVSIIQASSAATVFEDFRGNPLTNGWRFFGETNLFRWNATNQNLEVAWDSSKPNSYFYKPLGESLNRDDDFTLYLDLRLKDIAIGTTSNKPYTFQIAVGLLHFETATNAAFLRGTGFDSPNLFEFNYFPDSGFGATISPTAISSNGHFASGFIIQEMNTEDLFRIIMRNDVEQNRIQASIYRNGSLYAQQNISYPGNFTDFAVDTLAIASYSDAGQWPDYAGSILAHGTVDNLIVTTSAIRLDVGFTARFENGHWRAEFDTMPGWHYLLQCTPDFSSWTTVGTHSATNSGRATITHTNPPAGARFYTIEATRL